MATQSPSFAKLNDELRGKKAEASKSRLKTDKYSPTAPRDAVQNLVVYHFYRGNEEFWMEGLMDEPEWPKEYCKVVQLRCTFKRACRVTSEDGWKDEPEVVDTWPWVHYKNEDDGFRCTASGDVIVEDNGNAWFWAGSTFRYLGKAYNKAADPDPADAAGDDAASDDGERASAAPSMDVFDDGESSLVAAERAAEEARLRGEIAEARERAAEEAAAAAAAGDA
ncbi:uncharacterized protein AMSG_04038 [Thecamonas trahens ATCC 50062]|uniref:Uncharacterized protein n=1 Tax=Thecamonas trahens ATCC 50062 TaxID=461836 RepID=A0A0L0D629_THETB|nr:hypothetical protein AMSG_04038 [Thecamonas trahens ATCC 50062]KNC47809.1 hypothetical protein AMSG_04038 [Thecamonas trahens ATCC 50062]|eukprot:XP_013759287.1 hypothetical protein AMSG_04038 [Thecamonas trahens ATCC 50062]